MSEQPLDLRVTARALKRRKLTVGLLALVGLAGGIGYAKMRPPPPSATALVYVPPPAGATAEALTNSISTQVVIATSTPVLEAAAKAVSPPLTLEQLRTLVHASDPSPEILQVRARGSNDTAAIALANAVSSHYVQLAPKLSPGSLGGLPHVIQPGTAVAISKTQGLVRHGALGAAIGLVAGILLVLLRFRRDQRLRLRDEVAHALGLPVIGSVHADARKSVRAWTDLLDHYEPSSVDSWNLRRVLHRMLETADEDSSHVRVFALSDDRCALAAGVQLYAFARTLGMPATLVPREDETLVPLRAAASTRSSDVDLAGGTSGWEDALSRRSPPGEPRSEARTTYPRVIFSIAAVNETRPEVDSFDGSTLIAVSSGYASAEALARMALAITDAGHVIGGILVVNPDPSDSTTGSIPAGSISRALPTRVAVPEPPQVGRPASLRPASGVPT
jgi:capsular polysaccharide biosynthesis protein